MWAVSCIRTLWAVCIPYSGFPGFLGQACIMESNSTKLNPRSIQQHILPRIRWTSFREGVRHCPPRGSYQTLYSSHCSCSLQAPGQGQVSCRSIAWPWPGLGVADIPSYPYWWTIFWDLGLYWQYITIEILPSPRYWQYIDIDILPTPRFWR